MVQSGEQYFVTIGVRNDTNTTISNIDGGIYPYRNGEFEFNPVQENNYLEFNYPGTVVSGQTVTLAQFTINVIGEHDNINIQTEIDYDVDVLGLSRATYGSFRLPVGVWVDPETPEVESNQALYPLFTEDFSDPATLGTNWIVQGNAWIEAESCLMENSSMYDGIKLNVGQFQDFCLTFYLNNDLGGSGNQITEVLVRHNDDSWAGLRIKDKESHWVWLVDSNDNQTTGYANLNPGFYQLSAAGSLITFQNQEGSGSPIYLELATTITDPGNLVFRVNEEKALVDNITVSSFEPLPQEEEEEEEVEEPEPDPGFFFDDFSQGLQNWQTDAYAGEVDILDQQLHLRNGGLYAYATLTASGYEAMADTTVTFYLNTKFGGGGNQITEILLRHSGNTWAGVRIKDKETHPLRLVDSTEMCVQQDIDLEPGFYQVSLIGPTLTFQNVEGSGTPVFFETQTAVTQPGSLTIRVNEEETTIDDVMVEAL